MAVLVKAQSRTMLALVALPAVAVRVRHQAPVVLLYYQVKETQAATVTLRAVAVVVVQARLAQSVLVVLAEPEPLDWLV